MAFNKTVVATAQEGSLEAMPALLRLLLAVGYGSASAVATIMRPTQLSWQAGRLNLGLRCALTMSSI